jgi:Na+-driven multidrug efflux pump
MSDQHARPHRAVDHFVFLLTCGFLLLPFADWMVRSSRGIEEESIYTVFAPFAAVLVLVPLVLLIELAERRMAGSRPSWPPALAGIPLACAASGLAFASVYPGHAWWRDGFAGAAWGTLVAVWGWQRSRRRELVSAAERV